MHPSFVCVRGSKGGKPQVAWSWPSKLIPLLLLFCFSSVFFFFLLTARILFDLRLLNPSSFQFFIHSILIPPRQTLTSSTSYTVLLFHYSIHSTLILPPLYIYQLYFFPINLSRDVASSSVWATLQTAQSTPKTNMHPFTSLLLSASHDLFLFFKKKCKLYFARPLLSSPDICFYLYPLFCSNALHPPPNQSPPLHSTCLSLTTFLLFIIPLISFLFSQITFCAGISPIIFPQITSLSRPSPYLTVHFYIFFFSFHNSFLPHLFRH